MKLLYFSLKGGVGKSSISLNHALYEECAYITNDISTTVDTEYVPDFHQIPPNSKRIPKKLLAYKDAIYDFGAMSSAIDAKVTHAVLECDGVVIPTLTDQRSLEATIKTYKLIQERAKKIIIIINNYTNSRKFDYAYDYLYEQLPEPIILDIRTTTLFERVARDGVEWFDNVGHSKGEYQLLKTKEKHNEIYRTIQMLMKG